MKHTAQTGFTLIEMLVVLMLAVTLVGIVGPRLSQVLPGVEIKTHTQKTASLLRYARGQAISTTSPVAVRIGSDQHSLTVGERRYKLPLSLELAVIPRMTMIDPLESPALIFYPDGSSSGGVVQLSNDTAIYRIQVNWLTGEVSIDDE